MGQIEQLEQLAKSAGCDARRQEFMNKHTTFKIGGPAELFLIVHSEKASDVVFGRKGNPLPAARERLQYAGERPGHCRCGDQFWGRI